MCTRACTTCAAPSASCRFQFHGSISSVTGFCHLASYLSTFPGTPLCSLLGAVWADAIKCWPSPRQGWLTLLSAGSLGTVSHEQPVLPEVTCVFSFPASCLSGSVPSTLSSGACGGMCVCMHVHVEDAQQLKTGGRVEGTMAGIAAGITANRDEPGRLCSSRYLV